MFWSMAGLSKLAAKNWLWSWKRRVTTGSSTTRLCWRDSSFILTDIGHLLSYFVRQTDQGRPLAMEAFAGQLLRRVDPELRAHRDFRGRVIEHIGGPFRED